MQVGEGISIAIAAQTKDPSCDEEDDKDPGWTSRVNKFNSKENCTGTRLYDHMWANKADHEKKDLGVVPAKKAGTKFSLSNINTGFFPVQAHHLIPKNFLPNQPVCVWLAIKYKKNKKYELLFDSDYDTDHHHNGYCLPYASALSEWKGKRTYDDKFLLGCEVIEATELQLHQGSHTLKFDESGVNKKFKVPLLPIKDKDGGGDSDDGEMDEIETAGYLDKVKELLKVVHGKTLAHVEQCDICKQKKQGNKYQVLPLKSVVEMMDQVSHIIKILIEAHVIYVSWYSYAYAYKNELIYGNPGNYDLSDDVVNLLKHKLKGVS